MSDDSDGSLPLPRSSPNGGRADSDSEGSHHGDQDHSEKNNSSSLKSKSLEEIPYPADESISKVVEPIEAEMEIPLPPDSSDSSKYSPTQAVIEDASPPASESHQQQQLKKPIKVLGHAQAKKRLQAFSAAKLAAVTSSAVKKSPLKGVSVFSGRKDDSSKQQPTLAIASIKEEETKMREILAMNTILNEKLKTVHAITGSLPGPGPVTAIVKPTILNPEARNISEASPAPVKTEMIKVEEKFVVKKQQKNIRKKRTSSSSSHSSRSRSRTPPRRRDRRSRTPPEKERERDRGRDRDNNSSRRDRERESEKRRRSGSRNRDGRRRSPSPKKLRKRSRERKHRSRSRDADIGKSHTNNREGHHFKSPERKVKLSTISPPPPSSSSRSSKKIPSSPSASNIKDTRKSRSRSASNDNNTSSSTRRRSRSSSRDRSSRRRKSPKSKSSSKDSEKEKERAREREKEKQVERERKEKEEKREAERRRLEAAERELDKIRTSKMPEDWFEYKKYKYSIEHVREVWNLILSKELKSANKSSGGGTDEPERPASLAKAFHQSPSPIKTIQIELKNNLKRDYPAFCVQTTKQKPPVEYGCNPLSYAGYYKTREEILNEESPEIVKLLLDLINGASKTTTTPAPPIPKKSQEWFAENLKTFCPSEGSKGVVISHLYSDEEVEEATSTKVSSKSEKSAVHKLLPESSVPVPVNRVEPMEEQDSELSESSAETVPSPLLKTGFDKDAEHESDASGRRHRTEDDDDDVEEEDILEEIPLSKDETVTVKSSKKAEEEQRRPKKEKKKRKEKKKESSSKHSRHRRGSKKVQVESDEAESEAGSSSGSEPVVEVKPSKRSKAVEVVVAVETKGKQPSSDKKKKDKRAHSKKKSSKKRRKSSSESAESEHSSSSESSGEDSPDNEKRAKKKLKKKKKSKRSSSKKGDGKGHDSPDEDRNDKGGSGGGAGGSSGRGDESRRRDKDGGERDKDRKGKDRSKEHSKKSSKSSRRRHERVNDEGEANSGDESSSSYGSGYSTETSSSCETNSESPSPASVIRSMELDPRLEFALKEINVVESKTDESRVYDHLLKTAGVGDSSSKIFNEKYDPFRSDDKYDPFRVEDVEHQVDLFRNEPYKNPEQPRSIMDDQGTEDLLKTLDNDPMLQLVMNQHLVSAENLLASISEPMTSSVLADVKVEKVLEPSAITEDTFGKKTLGQWNEIIRPESPIRCASKEHENKQRLQHTQQQATQRLLSPSPTRATGRNASPPMEPPMLNEKSREGNPPLGLHREPPRRSYSRSYSRSRSRSFSPPPGRRLRRSRSRSISPRARGRSISPRARGRSISPGARGRSMSPGPRGRAMSPGPRRRSISPGARGRSISPPNARGYRRSVSHSPSPADRGGRRRRSVSHSLSPEWRRRHSRSPSPHRRPYHHRSHHHHRERRHGYDRYHRERRGRRGYERVHDDYYNDRRPRRDEDAHHWERERLLDPPSPDGYRRHRSYDRGMDRDRAEKDALSYEAAYRDRLYADEHNHHHHDKGLAYPPLPVGGGMRDASPPLRLNVADSTISDSELPDGGPAAFAVMEDDRGTRSNLKQIVLDPAVGTGTESTAGFASPPKRLSLDERLEVEMGIKLRESGPGQMDSFGYYGRNVPGTSGLALPFSQHAALGWTDPQRVQNTPQAPPAAPKQSQAIPLGELIQVLPAQMLDRSFTVTKDLSGLNPFEVQQTAAQVIRKAGDVVDPSKCISVKVPVLPFKIPVFSHPDPDIFVDKENREQERRQRRERKRLEDKKKQYERKRQLAKKKLLEKKMARLARKKQLESQQDANKKPVALEEEKKTEPEEKNQVTDSMGDENSSSKEMSTAVISADKPQAMKNEEVTEVESKPTVADTPAETELVNPPEESAAAEVKTDSEVTKVSKKEETGANESSLEQENKQAAPVLPIQLKGILYITGLKKEKSSKGVKFADGILPGDGSSLSENEEIHSPPPIPGGVKKRKKKMKSSRKKEKKLKQQQKPEEELKQNEPLLLPPPPPPMSSYPYCPLGLLYQFNPPYAIVYAQSMAELGFEITFTPSMEAPRGFAGEDQVKEESADVLQQSENKASGEPVSPVGERSSSSHRELKKKRKERRKADAKAEEDQASESSNILFKEPKERPPQVQSIPTIVSVKPAAIIKGPPLPTKSHNFQAPDAVRIELANEVQEGPAPRTVGGGVPAEDKSDKSIMELCDPASTNTPVENTIHVLTKNSRIENHRVHRISSGGENHRKSTKYYESKSLAKYGESYQNHRNEYRRVERIHTERKSSESKPPRTDSGNPNLIRISPSREILPASELEAGKNVVEESKTPELDADGSVAVFNNEKLATPIPIISRGNQPIQIKMSTKKISRPAASPVSFGLNHQERPSEHNKSSSSSLVTIHPAESTSSPSVLSPMLSSVPREVQVNGPEFDVVAAAGLGTYSAPTRLLLSNASLDSPVQPSLPPVFSAATKIPDVRISSSSRRLPFKSNRN